MLWGRRSASRRNVGEERKGVVNTPLQEVVRRKLVEGRQNTWFKNGERVFGRGSPITYRLLQFSSLPFHYTGIVLVDSGTWKSQKIIEILNRQDEHVWSGVVTFRAARAVQPNTVSLLHEFLEAAIAGQPFLFLDSDLGFWSEKWPDWQLTYRSTSTIEQHVAEGMVTRRGNPVCYITVEGSATQP